MLSAWLLRPPREVSDAHSTPEIDGSSGGDHLGTPIFETGAGDGRAGGPNALRENAGGSSSPENAAGGIRSAGHLDRQIVPAVTPTPQQCEPGSLNHSPTGP